MGFGFLYFYFPAGKRNAGSVGLILQHSQATSANFLAGAETKIPVVSVYLNNASLSQVHCTGMREMGAAIQSTLTEV